MVRSILVYPDDELTGVRKFIPLREYVITGLELRVKNLESLSSNRFGN